MTLDDHGIPDAELRAGLISALSWDHYKYKTNKGLCHIRESKCVPLDQRHPPASALREKH